MNVVLDSNIIISALRFGGPPRQIIELLQKGECVGIVSEEVMKEVEVVLFRKFKMLPSEWVLVTTVLRDFLVVVPTPELRSVPGLRDARDIHILAAAEQCAVDYVVSGDKDLLVLGHYKNIPIITASTCIDLLLIHPKAINRHNKQDDNPGKN